MAGARRLGAQRADLVDVDTAACFGCWTCPGIHREKHNAYLDITRAAGMGPCLV
jgi:hypothetical protein